MFQTRIGDLCAAATEPLEVAETPEVGQPGVVDLRVIDGEFVERRQARQRLQALPGDLWPGGRESFESREPREVNESLVGNRTRQDELLEVEQFREVSQPGVTDGCAVELEDLELVESGDRGKVVVADVPEKHQLTVGQRSLVKSDVEPGSGSGQATDSLESHARVPERELPECGQGGQFGQALIRHTGLVEHESLEPDVAGEMGESGVGDCPGKDYRLQVLQLGQGLQPPVVEPGAGEIESRDFGQPPEMPGVALRIDRQILEVEHL